jgi:hypothetical protein
MQFVPDWRGLGGKEATGDVEKVVFVTIQPRFSIRARDAAEVYFE